jgi:hypothetical protein
MSASEHHKLLFKMADHVTSSPLGGSCWRFDLPDSATSSADWSPISPVVSVHAMINDLGGMATEIGSLLRFKGA